MFHDGTNLLLRINPHSRRTRLSKSIGFEIVLKGIINYAPSPSDAIGFRNQRTSKAKTNNVPKIRRMVWCKYYRISI